ncbi:MAG: hypothetical protein SOZ28_00230 [Clostridia bacterium]|nr:hypothetical protein [Clostridia bacterium]
MKKIVALVLTVFLLMSLCSCGISSDTELKKQIEQLQQENEALRKQVEALSSGGTIGNNTDKEDTEKTENTVTPIALNSPFNVGEIMTITLFSSEWCEELLPSNTSGGYSYMKDVEGEKFFVVHGELKNLAGQTLDVKYAGEARIVVNGKYKLTATMELEENDGKSFYGNAKPLQTLPLVIYTSVSDELYETCKDIQLSMDLVNDEEKIGYFYDESYSHDSFQISFNK